MGMIRKLSWLVEPRQNPTEHEPNRRFSMQSSMRVLLPGDDSMSRTDGWLGDTKEKWKEKAINKKKPPFAAKQGDG